MLLKLILLTLIFYGYMHTLAQISLGGFPALTCSGTFSQSLGSCASNQTGFEFPSTLLTVPRYPL